MIMPAKTKVPAVKLLDSILLSAMQRRCERHPHRGGRPLDARQVSGRRHPRAGDGAAGHPVARSARVPLESDVGPRHCRTAGSPGRELSDAA